MDLLELDPLAREGIGLFGREGVEPSGVCLIADLVEGRTTYAAMREVSTPLALLPLDRLLSEGFSSHLAFGPLLPPSVIKFIGNLQTVMLPGVLKGLLSF